MATLPSANVTLQNSAGVYAVGVAGYIAVFSCVNTNADMIPRVYASTQDLLSFYNYCPGIDYCSMHFDETDLPVIFVGLPITTAGAIYSIDNSLVTGTAAITPSAAPSGIMDELHFVITCTSSGTVGSTSGPTPVLSISADGGNTTQATRLGSSLSYTIPYVGVVLTFASGGTLNEGDVFKFRTTAPMWQNSAITTARENLANQLQLARSVLVVGDMATSSPASTIVTEMNNYASEDERFVYARTQAYDVPSAKKAQLKYAMNGATQVVFASSGETITRTSGSFVTDGFAVGQILTIAGSTSNNGSTAVLTGVSATVLTASGASFVAETDTMTIPLISGSETLAFASAGTITRAGSSNSFVTEGFLVGDMVTIAGSTSNNGTIGPLTAVTSTVLTVASGVLVNEGPDPSVGISITKTVSLAAWENEVVASFVTIAADPRIDIAAGRARKLSPITGWNHRRPASWAASLREYQHDVQIPCWRKDDGPLVGWDLTDGIGNVIEYDERADGGLLEAGFTTLRTWANGPLGAFVALSLTRDSDGSLLSRTHNLAVVDVAMTTVQAATEGAVGTVLILNSDGTATTASLGLLQQKVNKLLQQALLSSSLTEGPRCSSVNWTPSATAILNTTGATLPGTLAINLNGTLEQLSTLTTVS
jgi:hypothetical protein